MYMQKIIKFIFPIVISLVAIVSFSNTYRVGGDDTKLYYAFPLEFIENFGVNLYFNNTLSGAHTGYQSVAYFIPLFTLSWILKIIPLINNQLVIFIICILGGFYSIRLLLRVFVGIPFTSLASSLVGLIYIFNPMIIDNNYRHLLPPYLLVFMIPLSVTLLHQAIVKEKNKYIYIIALIYSSLSLTMNTVPWLAAFLVTSIPLLIFYLVKYKVVFIKKIFILSISIVSLNLYWIIPNIDSFIVKNKTNTSSVYSSEDFHKENMRIVSGTSESFYIWNTLFNYNSPEKTTKFIPYGILIIFCIATLMGNRVKGDKWKYLLIVLGFILSLYLSSPNWGDSGVKIFIWMTKNIPLWGMFRNMQDKFAISFAFWSSMLVGLSIYRNAGYKYRIILTLLTLSALCVTVIFKNNISQTSIGNNKFSGKFNQDFNLLIDDVRKNSYNRILWLPLNFPAYLTVSDSEGNYYSGPSPLRELANITDYTGEFSFLTSEDLKWGNRIFTDLLQERDYEFKKAIRMLDIKYVAINYEQLDEKTSEFYYGGENLPLLRIHDYLLHNDILGEKVAEYGDRYELYKISTKFMQDNPEYLPIQYSTRLSYENELDIVPSLGSGIEVVGSKKADISNLKINLPIIVNISPILSFIFLILIAKSIIKNV